MLNLEDIVFNKIKLGNIWLFITECCNLRCDYCFFSDRKAGKTLAFSQFEALVQRLSSRKKYDFVLSGGEPLLRWPLVKKTTNYICKNFPGSKITLQTNLFFLTPQKAQFFKKRGVVIEPGIDGDYLSNYRHRKGFTQTSFKKCLCHLQHLVSNRFPVSPTMTVHPHEVKAMFDNFARLISLGLHSIEVHPAFLAAWDKQTAQGFLAHYKKILMYEAGQGKYLVSKDYSKPCSMLLDFVVQPDGFVLPNWTFLSFPKRTRRPFSIMQLTEKGIVIMQDQLRAYLAQLNKFFVHPRTYRDFSNFNAASIIKKSRSLRLTKHFLAYKELCEKVQVLDQASLNENGGP